MRVAYLLMVHRAPEQVRTLLAALPDGSPVFVHVDARASRATFRAIAALRADRPFTLVRRHRCYWGRLGMVRATLALAEAALADGAGWDYATLLSGADYPIVSNERIAAFLEAHRGEQFISSWDLRAENPWKHAPGRFQSDSRVDRLHVGAGRRVLRFPWRRRMPYGLHPFGGSQWWTLSRDAVRYVVDYPRTHPRLLPFMRGVFIPDECFVQTVLANSPFRDTMAADDLRFAIWDRPAPPYPAIMQAGDVAAMAASGKLYARKFDRVSAPDGYAAVDAELRSA